MKFIRIIKWIIIPPFILAMILLTLLVTEQGFRSLIFLADSLSGAVFSVERVEGRLLSAWRLEKIKVKIDKGDRNLVTVEIDELAVRWRAYRLFKGVFYGEFVIISGVRVWLPAGEEEKKKDVRQEKGQYKLPEINLPIRLIMDEFLIRDLSVFSLSYPDDSLKPFVINELLVKAEMSGDKLRVEQFKLDTPGFGGKLAAGVEFHNDWPLTIAGDWFFVTADAGKLDGRVGLKGDLEELVISMQLEAPFVAEINAEVSEVLSDKLNWQVSASSEEVILNDLGLDLPLNGTLNTADFSGTLQTYKGSLSAELNYSDKPPVRVESRIDGDLSGVDISFLRLLAGESVLSVTGRVGWGESLSWQADLKGEKLPVELFSADWPGKIDLSVKSEGQWDDSLRAALEIKHLGGELRGFPIAGTGSMTLAGEELIIDNLFLQSGVTSLQVNGQAGNEINLSFQAESEDLASLIPESSGSFTAKGRVGGSRDVPRIIFALNGASLAFKEYSIDEIEADINLDTATDGIIKAEVKGSRISGAGEYIDKVLVKLMGTREEHTLVMEAVADLGRIAISFGGGLRDEQWQGELAKLKFSSERFGNWQTEQPAVLRVGSSQAGVADFILRHGGMSLYLDGEWDQKKGWDVKSRLEEFSLQLLEEWGFDIPPVAGIITAGLTARGNGNVPEEAQFTVLLPDLILTGEEEDGKAKKWTWLENNFAISLKGGEAEITLLSRLEDGSKGELGVVVKNIDFTDPQLGHMTLDGNMTTAIYDISFLTPLSYYMVNASGGFSGNASLSGTAAVPVVNGDFALDDGEIFVPALNISVDELEFSVSGDGKDNVVEMSAVSGEGRITLAGEVNNIAKKQWLADIGISGERFKVVNLDEYQAEINPDIRLLYNNKDGIFLDGTITVPMAYIAPEEFQKGVVTASADVVVIDYEGQEQQGDNLPLSFDLEVVLGEDVEIDTFGIQGYLGGRLRLVSSPGNAVTAFGNLNLKDGIFVFSDTELEISRALIFYQGGAVGNPAIDIRAERKVDDKEVGVLISGTASQLKLDLFSNPSMDDSDILSYIVSGKKMSGGGGGGEGAMLKAAAESLGMWTGGKVTDGVGEFTGLDIDLESGDGDDSGLSLVVGREIADGLYISYGSDLSSSLGTFRVRYDLDWWGFSLETESSSEESGVDLFWSWER